ncbi:MAG: type VI secretion system membrane subunit TssM [Azoarcus sp.]|jgi:type VI secretion system protein ImpL|nr:type VI secretion system membrane subunit TssM [Azoarcus sp.]
MKINLKYTKTISAIGFLILIALIWFIGPFFGLSAETCLVLIFGVMLLWVLTLLTGQLLAARAGRLIEKMLHSQADAAVLEASADRRSAVKLLREQLLTAINTLKTSRLGKTHGSAALYELPWYMIIGPSAVGKSTALLQSGLTFPFSDQGGSVQGVGGTRNCDWFFTTEGVLLDTAGRYTTQSENLEEWLGFLKLLKRYRSKAPVNGILVATGLPELLRYDSEDFTLYARQIRERIHEIEDIFGVRVPIYLIFTKLDLLGGFSQFFEDLDEAGRNRVWGATLSHELESDVDISREVGRQCELLYRGLRQIGEEKLALLRGIGAKPALFTFPHEFHSLKEGVERLIELLHEDDPYHAKPLLRGFYFTSAMQSAEQPHIAAAARVSSQFGLARSGFGPNQPLTTNSYFLHDLFREVLFPDQHLIMRQTRPHASRLRLSGMFAGVSALILCIGLLTHSWVGNRGMLDAVRINHAQASELIAHDALIDKLKSLTLLQKHLEELQQHRANGTPWQISMGLYQGRKLETPLRKEYFDGIVAVMLSPLQSNLEESLSRFTPAALAAAPDAGSGNGQPASLPTEEGYEALKTYLMLADERRNLDTDYLAEQMQRYWHGWLKARQGEASMDEIETEARKLVAFYVSQLQAQAPDVPLIINQLPVVDDARLVLRNATTRPQAKELVYNDLKSRANSRFPALGVTRILDGKDDGIVAGAFAVPGAFTREAQEQFMENAITEASRGEIKGDDWVLAVSTAHDGGSSTSDEINKNRAEIEALYRADYFSAWMKFLQGISIPETPSDVAQAARMLERLSNPQKSPLKIVLQRVAYETAWDNPSQIANAAEDARNKVVASGLVNSRVSSRASRLPNFSQEKSYGPLGRQFAALAAVTEGDGTPPLVGYLEHLGRLKGQLNPIAASDDQPTTALKLILATLNATGSEFFETMQYLDNTLLDALGEQAFKDILRPLLAAPLLKSYATLLPPVEQSLNETWQNEVHDQWMTLANKYPFASDSQNEARVSEIASMVGRGGTIDKYIGEYLAGLVIKRSGGQFLARNWSELGVRFSPQFLASAGRLSLLGSALSSSDGGSARGESSRFELRPVPTPGLAEITVEIDGQTLRYRNGPQPWQAFNWPGNDAQGARIQVIANNGTVSTVSNQPGRMGLMKMFGESARRLESDMNSGQMEWRFRGSEGAQQSVKLDFRMAGGLNPLFLTALGRVDLPRRITQQ